MDSNQIGELGTQFLGNKWLTINMSARNSLGELANTQNRATIQAAVLGIALSTLTGLEWNIKIGETLATEMMESIKKKIREKLDETRINPQTY